MMLTLLLLKYFICQINVIITCMMIDIIVRQLIVGKGVASSFVSDLRSSIIFLPKVSF